MQRVESCHLFAVLHAPRQRCRELSLVICLFSCQSMHMSKQRMCKEECKKRTLVIPCSVFFYPSDRKSPKRRLAYPILFFGGVKKLLSKNIKPHAGLAQNPSFYMGKNNHHPDIQWDDPPGMAACWFNMWFPARHSLDQPSNSWWVFLENCDLKWMVSGDMVGLLPKTYPDLK